VRWDAARLRRAAVVGAAVVGGYVVLLVVLLSVGARVTPPESATALTPAGGGIGAAAHQLLGRPGGTDFLVDYVSAKALRTDDDAYAITADLTERFGEPWPVSTANPHPPTLLPLVLPFTALRYTWALSAWALAMIGVYAATARVVGATWLASVGIAFGLAVTFPGAFAIGNPLPLIGLGAAIAIRYRHDPALAGIGLALAAAPKLSGLLLVVPFLLAWRWRTLLVAGGILGFLAAVPVAFQRDIWSRYLDLGVEGARLNADRGDNGSLFKLVETWGLPSAVAVLAIGAATLALVLRRRELFTPLVWTMVAALPIAWMYSLVTLLPVAVILVLRGRPVVRLLVALATALMLASPPAGQWPVTMFPVVLVVMFVAMILDTGALPGPARDPDPASIPAWIPGRWSRTPDGAAQPDLTRQTGGSAAR